MEITLILHLATFLLLLRMLVRVVINIARAWDGRYWMRNALPAWMLRPSLYLANIRTLLGLRKREISRIEVRSFLYTVNSCVRFRPGDDRMGFSKACTYVQLMAEEISVWCSSINLSSTLCLVIRLLASKSVR